MPIPYEVTLYGCRWKCGTRRTEKVKLIEAHERTCFANPERRACRTCKHDHKGRDLDDCYCDHPDGEELRPNDSGDRLSCRADCPAWEPKEKP
jgi:hypothetical protein